MPSKKIFISMIICCAIVVSTWLLTRKADSAKTLLKESAGVVAVEQAPIESNQDWRKILTNVSTTSKTFVNLTGNTGGDETTLTAQMSRDFMSQYLLLKKGGREVTPEEANQIATNVMSIPEYTQPNTAVYIQSNLHITNSKTKDTYDTYKTTVNYMLKKRSSNIKDDPMTILANVMQTDNTSELTKLDPLIASSKALVIDLLNMEVPNDAIRVHLDLINSVSNLSVNLESMKGILNDPVKTMTSISTYNQNILAFATALKNINLYFITKTGSQ